MSEEPAVAVETPPAEAPQPGEGLISSQERTESPFDSIFEEGKMDVLPDNIKNWASRYKNGMEFEKALHHQKIALSQKGHELPDENAPQDVLDAHREHIRNMLRIPEKVEDYDWKAPEGYEDKLTPEYREKITEWAFNNDVGPSQIESFLPFQIAMETEALKMFEKQQKEAEKEQLTQMNETFEKNGWDLASEEKGLAEWAEKEGLDPSNLTDFWVTARRLKTLLGEDKHIEGVSEAPAGQEDIMKQLSDLSSGETNLSKAFLGTYEGGDRNQLREQANALSLKLNKQISEMKNR